MRPKGMQDLKNEQSLKSGQEPKSAEDGKGGQDDVLRETRPAATRRVRGLRDVMSSAKTGGGSGSVTYTQQLTEISWMDRELERLRRESTIMEANMARVNGRILEITSRREMLMTVLREELNVKLAPDAPVAPPRTRNDEEADEHTVEEFSLEY